MSGLVQGMIPGQLAVTDFDADGNPDIAVITSGQLALFLGNGDGTFGAALSYVLGQRDVLAAGDFDGDGVPDLVTPAGFNVALLLSRGATPTTVPPSTPDQADGPTPVQGAETPTQGQEIPTTTPAESVPGIETPSRRYVSRLYRDLLFREAEPEGLAFWSGLLDRGATREQVALGIEGSTEYRTKLVEGLYRKLLAREADAAGLDYFTALLNAGVTAEQVEALILGSPEYRQNRGGGTATGFLQALRRDVLGPDSDPQAGAALALEFLRGMPSADLAGWLLTGAEGQRAEAEGLCAQFLRRPAGTADLDFFATALSRGARSDAVLAALLASDEYLAAP